MSIRSRLRALTEKWHGVPASERANYQLYIGDLCEALDVSKPQPAGTGFQYEMSIQCVNQDGTTTAGHADLFRYGHFLLEAKDRETGRSDYLLLRRAFGQAIRYAAFAEGGPPPFLLVLDVGSTLLVWDRWSGGYGDFASGRRIDLRLLDDRPDDVKFIRTLWENPQSLDPRVEERLATREIAEHLAQVASALEDRGHEQEAVARFLMRCVFSAFAEDIGLLPDNHFTRAIELGMDSPEELADALRELWKAMDAGTRFGLQKLLEFNGHFFHDQEVLELQRDEVAVLLEAARADWTQVEPAIFGTLLTRALDPKERHRLGAEFTPREFVERVVRPTIEEPVREKWTAVQAEVLQLRERGRKTDLKAAIRQLRGFHGWLRGLSILDPACGSGNFLYVSMAMLKGVELEVFREIEALTGQPELAVEEVGPWQFHGIEVKAWAREIAELVLWIGFHQWWRRTHGHAQPPQPVLRDTGTLECRDAVLAWDELREDADRARPDPTLRLAHPVSGEQVPDPNAKLRYWEHVGARPAQWPRADFIVGNPPYMGRGRQREAFGDGYVDALRAAYPDVPDNADYVMYWWYRAAECVASGRTFRAGLLTTNTIRQKHNRELIAKMEERGAHLLWAVPDHPWVDETGSAAVRVSMTVLGREELPARILDVDDSANVVRERIVQRLNADLTAHADVPRAAGEPLLANAGLCSQGFILVGSGFILDRSEAWALRASHPESAEVVRPYLTGSDLTGNHREQYVIDFGLRNEEEAREYPVFFDIVRDRVKPMRDANNDRSTRENWWRFGRNRETFRSALGGIDRFIATVETSKHRFFVFLTQGTTPSHTVICIALGDYFTLGVLSSSLHLGWALAAGGRLEDRPRYQKLLCFDPFPFPTSDIQNRNIVGTVMQRLDAHRTRALAGSDTATMTGLYNIIGKLRDGATLTDAERDLHTKAGCGVLRDLHDELDRAVSACYGWEWPLSTEEILSRLVMLHDERLAEEKQGTVGWLRPDYQKRRFADTVPAPEVGLESEGSGAGEAGVSGEEWPEDVIAQLRAIRRVLGVQPMDIADLAKTFDGASRTDVRQHIEALSVLGAVQVTPAGQYQAVALERATSGR